MRKKSMTVFFITTVIFMFICTISANAQKTKRVEIYKNNMYKDYLDAIYYYDENNELKSISVILYGQDLRYQQLVEIATIYSGTPKELMKFLNKVETFVSENDPDISTTIDGRKVDIVKLFGIKGYYISEKESAGYRGYNLKTWGKIKNAFIKWANENNETIE